MAETLGSLIDKLSIKSIREFHINEMLANRNMKFPKAELDGKLNVLKKQKYALYGEIEDLVNTAVKKGVALKDEKLKLYNKPDIIGKIGNVKKLSDAIEGLVKKNLELWHLEDEARKVDVDLAYIGGVKKKIDVANQHRNDFMDRIDDIFAKKIKCQK